MRNYLQFRYPSKILKVKTHVIFSSSGTCFFFFLQDCKSIISSLTAPEVEKKLIDVLQENLRLKETLEENNLSMKKHLNMLVTRQQELSKVHEAHRVKFAETKDLVNQLKIENSELKTKLERQDIERNEQETQARDPSFDYTISLIYSYNCKSYFIRRNRRK